MEQNTHNRYRQSSSVVVSVAIGTELELLLLDDAKLKTRPRTIGHTNSAEKQLKWQFYTQDDETTQILKR